jgi:AraC-like DNA-binding protein
MELSQQHLIQLLSMFKPKRVNSLSAGIQSAAPELGTTHPEYFSERNLERHQRHFELMLSLSGQAAFFFADQYCEARPGDVFLIAPRIRHSRAYFPINDHYCHAWFWLRPRFIQSAMIVRDQEFNKSCFIVFPDSLFSQYAYDELDNILRNQPSPEIAGMLIQSLAGLLAAKYCQILQHDLALKAPENREMKKCNIADICQYIEERHGVGISLEHMARMMHFSKFHFHRIFRSATGVTLHQYADRIRYRKALEMEKSGCLQKEIAAVLGFSSPSTYWFWRHRQHAPDKGK